MQTGEPVDPTTLPPTPRELAFAAAEADKPEVDRRARLGDLDQAISQMQSSFQAAECERRRPDISRYRDRLAALTAESLDLEAVPA